MTDPDVRWYTRKYGLTAAEARELLSLPEGRLAEIEREHDSWRAKNGFLAPSSPLSRGMLLDVARGKDRYVANEDLTWREVYAREYQDAEARGLQPWQARDEASRAAWIDYEARTGRGGAHAKRYAANGGGYFVWALARGSDEPLDEGPWGPYDTLDAAKTFARIGATEGAHDRAVSLGLHPQAPGFRIVRRYESGSGERIL